MSAPPEAPDQSEVEFVSQGSDTPPEERAAFLASIMGSSAASLLMLTAAIKPNIGIRPEQIAVPLGVSFVAILDGARRTLQRINPAGYNNDIGNGSES